MIYLKLLCYSCGGSGCYDRINGEEPVPCWVCHGKGWTQSVLAPPNPKWARQYKKYGPQFPSGKAVPS